MYHFFVSKITSLGPIISFEAIDREKSSNCNCACMYLTKFKIQYQGYLATRYVNGP